VPATIAGLGNRHGGPIQPGRPANLAIVDPEQTWTIDRAALASRSSNTPFHGREVRGKVRHTIFDGEAVVIDGEATR